jgi:hypothetical protein
LLGPNASGMITERSIGNDSRSRNREGAEG